jgi:hypothetical protein
MDWCWRLVILFSLIYAWSNMILIKIIIFCLSALFLIAGITNMVSPDINTVFIPFTVDGIQEAHFARSFSGFVAAVGYLSMRFLYSSSKVQVGAVVIYITCAMIVSKIFSFIYEGYTNAAIASFIIGIIFVICLFIVQKDRKNQLDYNL